MVFIKIQLRQLVLLRRDTDASIAPMGRLYIQTTYREKHHGNAKHAQKVSIRKSVWYYKPLNEGKKSNFLLLLVCLGIFAFPAVNDDNDVNTFLAPQPPVLNKPTEQLPKENIITRTNKYFSFYWRRLLRIPTEKICFCPLTHIS